MLFLALLAIALGAENPQPQILGRVAGTVNGEVITMYELEQRSAPALQKAAAEPDAAAREKARKKVLKATFDAVVAERLFQAQVAVLGVEVTDTEVDQVIEDVKKRNGLDDKTFEAVLPSQGFPDRASYRKTIRRDLETMRLLQMKIRSKVKVSDEDVKNYWQQHPQEFKAEDEVLVRHVFIPIAGTTKREQTRAREEATRVLARARSGEDFAKIARQASRGPSAAQGGELPWLKRGTIHPEIEKAAFALKQGEVSELVKTDSPAGFHVIKLEQRRGGTARPLDEVKEEIRERMMSEQAENYRSQFIDELRREAAVEIAAPELKD